MLSSSITLGTIGEQELEEYNPQQDRRKDMPLVSDSYKAKFGCGSMVKLEYCSAPDKKLQRACTAI